MGKVGSISVQWTLNKNYPGLVYHAHRYEALTKKAKIILCLRKFLRLPIYVICPIREPISRNISTFFQNFKRDTTFEFSDKKNWTSDELLDLFLRLYPHNECLKWFDTHLKTVFGLDVFSQNFPTKEKWKIYKQKSIRILIYRTDLEHSKQLDLISKFTEREISHWVLANIGMQKNYGEIYKNFNESLSLPDTYISTMCNSKFCQHFWSSEEIKAIEEKYRK